MGVCSERLQTGEILESLKLSRSQKVKLRIFGHVFLGMEMRQGWSCFLPIYLVRCKKHGLFETHPRGRGSLDCLKCREESHKKSEPFVALFSFYYLAIILKFINILIGGLKFG